MKINVNIDIRAHLYWAISCLRLLFVTYHDWLGILHQFCSEQTNFLLSVETNFWWIHAFGVILRRMDPKKKNLLANLQLEIVWIFGFGCWNQMYRFNRFRLLCVFVWNSIQMPRRNYIFYVFISFKIYVQVWEFHSFEWNRFLRTVKYLTIQFTMIRITDQVKKNITVIEWQPVSLNHIYIYIFIKT